MWKPLSKDKVFVIKPDICIGCRSCQLACSFHKAQMVDLSSAAIAVYRKHENASAVPLVCMQCEDPKCLKSCPAQAITKDEQSGVVKIDPDKCIHCKTCLHACPFGNIRHSVALDRMVKCDYCGGTPTCQQVCPVGAIDLVDASDFSVECIPLGLE